MKKTITIEGMSCNHCVQAVTKALNAISGVENVAVDLGKKLATIESAETVTDDALREAVEDAGFQVTEVKDGLLG